MRRVYFDRIAVDPEIMIGKPVFKGTRIPLYIILDLIGDGIAEEEIIRIYPDLTYEDIKAAMKFASMMQKGCGQSNFSHSHTSIRV